MDKIDKLNKNLKEVKENYETLKRVGVSEDILITYLKAKTKLSEKSTREFLSHLDNFYNGLLKEELVKEMEK